MLATRVEAGAELELLDTADVDLRAIAGRARGGRRATLRRAAAALSAKRSEAAGRLGRAVTRLLPELGMPGGKLEVALTALAEPSATGGESIAFVVRLNPGLDAQPLARTRRQGASSPA